MKFYHSFFLLVVLVFNMFMMDCTGVDPEVIEKGLETGEAITELMSSDKFESAMSSLAKGIGPYLSAIGPVFGFILSFFSEDEHLEYMKKMLEKIERRFDLVDDHFHEVSKQLDWSSIQANLGKHSHTIKVLNDALKNLRSTRNKELIRDYKDTFIRLYDNNWKNDPLVIYNSITSSDILHKNVLQQVRKVLENHRKKVQKIMLGLAELVIRGVSVELSYWELKNKTMMRQERETYWINKIKIMKDSIWKVDTEVKNYYYVQAKKDLEKLLRDREKDTHRQFAKSAYNFLTEKYNWRDWMVAAYDELHGGDKHWVKYCGGTSIFRTNGRNTVIASVPQSKKPIKKDKSLNNSHIMNSIKLLGRSSKWHFTLRCLGAETLFRKLPKDVRDGCRKYAGAGFIRQIKSKPVIEATPDRIVTEQKSCYTKHFLALDDYLIYLFG